MFLAGNDCVTDDEATTQFVIWSIVAAPLIMGNDLRKVSAPMRKLLLNPEIIAIDQDPLGKPGGRRTKLPGSIEVWTRELRERWGPRGRGLLRRAGQVRARGRARRLDRAAGGRARRGQPDVSRNLQKKRRDRRGVVDRALRGGASGSRGSSKARRLACVSEMDTLL